jgi:hypothetical protein
MMAVCGGSGRIPRLRFELKMDGCGWGWTGADHPLKVEIAGSNPARVTLN